MPVWTRSGSVDRRLGSVLPVTEDVEAFLPRKKSLGPTSNSTSTTARSLPARGWLWLFLVVNLFGICGFIFTSVVYFPSTSTAGVVEQAIKQGDVSLLEVSQPTPDAQPNVPSAQEPATVTDSEVDPEKPLVFVSGGETVDPALVPDADSVDPPSDSPVQQEQPPLVNIPTNPKLRVGKEATSTTFMPTFLPEEVSEVASPDREILTNNPVVPAGEEITNVPAVEQSAAPLPAKTFYKPLTGATILFTPEATTVAPTDPPDATLATTVEKNAMADLIRRMKMELDERFQPPSPAAATAKASTNSPQTVRFTPAENVVHHMVSMDLYHDLQEHLTVWLRAGDGVDIDNVAECKRKGGSSCRVNGWTSQLNSTVRFDPFDREQRPLWVPNAANSGHPSITFTCPMTSQDVLLHDSMTFFFVLSPRAVETGDTYLGQKFFGNSPYGQFLLHGGKPAYYTNGGLREIDDIVQNGRFALVTYRLHRHRVEIRLNGLRWGPDVPEDESYLVRMSGNTAVSLGNVKSVCDTNAFLGDIAEVLIYDSLLLDAQVDAVELYLRNKWQLPTPVATVGPGPGPNADRDNEQIVVNPIESTIRGDVLEDATQNKQPRTFDPEGVFEWKPPEELLEELTDEGDPIPYQQKWTKAVNEKIEAIRNFRFGGELLRSFIRNHRDELIALREDLFGQS